jgi:hypothetical protein
MLARAKVFRVQHCLEKGHRRINKSTCVGGTVEVFSPSAEYVMKQTTEKSKWNSPCLNSIKAKPSGAGPGTRLTFV